jgi:hypothetical protein
MAVSRSTPTSPSKLARHFAWCFTNRFATRKGALRSIADLFGVRIRIADPRTFRRRCVGLRLLRKRSGRVEPLHVLVRQHRRQDLWR